jgi:hypothetical protein
MFAQMHSARRFFETHNGSKSPLVPIEQFVRGRHFTTRKRNSIVPASVGLLARSKRSRYIKRIGIRRGFTFLNQSFASDPLACSIGFSNSCRPYQAARVNDFETGSHEI